jgi:hypothetical protein
MRRPRVWHVSARIQPETGRRFWRPRQRGPPVRTFGDLTKRHFMMPISARTGGRLKAYFPQGKRIPNSGNP